MVEECQEWMLYYKGESPPLIQDLRPSGPFALSVARKKTLVLRHMWDIAQRGDKRGHLQLKRRLLPDMRDPPERKCRSRHEGNLKLYMEAMEDYYMVEKMF